MTRIAFKAPEYNVDGTFNTAAFVFEGEPATGWTITRNGAPHLDLGPGYHLVSAKHCGVCSTDLARRFLPYPLPQVIGHEVIGERDGQLVVVEINASHKARGRHAANCPFCQGGMDSQCPERITLGINQLPGGFAPFFLAPEHAVIKVPDDVPVEAACLTEPLAAALQGVEATAPRNGDRVAVLGPRRLGTLILTALHGYRRRQGLDFEISALTRHPNLADLYRKMGADRVVNLTEHEPERFNESFDIVFDTTGSPAGFARALALTRRVLHLKSTHGQPVMGLSQLTAMVVDELALAPYAPARLDFTWPNERTTRENLNIYITPSVPESTAAAIVACKTPTLKQRVCHRMSVEEARQCVTAGGYPTGSPFPRFDLALVTSKEEADAVTRPHPEVEWSLVRPRGALLVCGDDNPEDGPIFQAVRERQIEIHTSRCGDFRAALDILRDNPKQARAIADAMITHRFPLDAIERAFETAADSRKSVKVIVDLNT